MKTLRTQLGNELHWARLEGYPRSAELRSADESFAILTRRKGTHFIGETHEGRWSFRRRGFLHQRVVICEGDSEQSFATVEMSWSGCGTLELPRSRRLRWTQTSFWRQRYVFRDERGRDLVHASASAFGKRRLTMDPAGRDVEEIPLLALLSGYLMTLAADDAAASIGASGAVFAGG